MTQAAGAGPAFDASFPAVAPRPPWWGGDLQTLRNSLRWRPPDLSPWPAERLALPMGDDSGDRLAASLHRPDGGAVGAPLVLLIHGLTGCEDSAYVRASARFWLARRHPVLRLNLRGAGPSRPLCRLQYHAGRSDDLRDALAALPHRIEGAGLRARGMIAVGYSLGGNMLLKYLGEEGSAAPFLAACAVSAPIDLAASTGRMEARRNGLYQHYILSRLKAETLAAPAWTDGAPALDARERRAVVAARSIRRFDDVFIAPRNGFAGAGDYYERCKALRYLDAIAVPTLLVHALDDPWIPAAAYLEYDWRRNSNLTPLLPESGGHVGFHARGNAASWHDRAMAAFVTSRGAGLGAAGASC